MQLGDGTGLRKVFFLFQIGIGAVFLFLILRLKFSTEKSRFKDRKKPFGDDAAGDFPKPKHRGPDLLAEAKIEKREKPSPLLLEGLSILDREPHEILGVSREASKSEIQVAFRELMKRFHPDRVGPPGSREWKDSQRISQAIIEAKETMLEKVKQQSQQEDKTEKKRGKKE